MPSESRFSFVLTQEMRQRIEEAKTSTEWRVLSLAEKIRILLSERLDQLESEKKGKNQ